MQSNNGNAASFKCDGQDILNKWSQNPIVPNFHQGIVGHRNARLAAAIQELSRQEPGKPLELRCKL